MERNKKLGLLIVMAFIFGAFVTIVITSQFNMTNQVVASLEETPSIEVAENINESNLLLQEQENLIAQLNGLFINAAKRVKPAVVTVYSKRVIKVRQPDFFLFDDEFFEQFFNRRRQRNDRNQEREYVQQGMGSGVIVKSDGIILTNYHVIKDADDIQVKTTDGNEYDAEVLGSDPKTDVAVLKVDVESIDFAPIGNSETLDVGEWVLAIGSPFSEVLRHTVTKGIVSALGRKGLTLSEDQIYQNFIQTDAPINHGNSGGALVNLRGEVIGINTAIVSPNGGFAGVGFAIPINMAKKVMDDLLTKGRVVRGYLGVVPGDVDEDMARALDLDDAKGALVQEVEAGSPADKAGLKPSDVIVKVSDVNVNNSDHLRFLIADIPPGKKVDVVVNRNGKEKNLAVILGELGEGTSEKPSTIISDTEIEKLGMEVTNITQEASQQFGYELNSGVLVARIDQSGIAYRKNLRGGDLIREVNRKKVTNVNEFSEIMKSIKPGNVVLFLVQRGRNNFFVAVEIPKG